MDALAAGITWPNRHKLSPWDRGIMWSGIVNSGCGFTMVYGTFIALGAAAEHPDNPMNKLEGAEVSTD